jgi:hypothetical protein
VGTVSVNFSAKTIFGIFIRCCEIISIDYESAVFSALSISTTLRAGEKTLNIKNPQITATTLTRFICEHFIRSLWNQNCVEWQ